MATRKRPKPLLPDTTDLPAALGPDTLSNPCVHEKLGFETTDELPRLKEVIGQPRAFRALELGSEITGEGFNIFGLGQPGSGRTTLIRHYLERKATDMPVPDDWCYVNNFSDPHRPKALRMPAGKSKELRVDIQDLVGRCEQQIPQAFEEEEYVQERDRLVNEMEKGKKAELSRLQAFAAKYNFVIATTPYGFIWVPAVEGKPLKPEDIEQLSEEQREKFEKLKSKVEEEVNKSLNRIRSLENIAHTKIREMDEQIALFVVGHLVDELKTKYADLDLVVTHLEAVKDDIVANANQFRTREKEIAQEALGKLIDRSLQQRYEVNVVIDNADQVGAPVILEGHPSYYNLIGRIEHEVIMGASRTDFTMIRPGALHRANGGYLIIPARDVLLNPYAWEGLERSLRDRHIRILELGAQLGLLSTSTLEPEPIPLDIKVILIGTPLLYYLLRAYDEDFAKLFKVRAEFASLMDRTSETEHEYALFVKAVVDDNHLPPFDNTAVARIVEFGSRLVEDQRKLSARFGKIADMIRESAYWAEKEGHSIVTGDSVDKANEEAIYRNNLLEERIQELLAQGTYIVDVTGSSIGQTNALSILMLGDYAFARPARVTASVGPGKEGVVDIERQAKLGGRFHTKGVLIINGFLGGRFGRKKPLNLSASITFEQSYEEVEGDSASAAELFALLSAIAQVPIRQDRSITGSIDQYGLVQPVGGVNEKIEGFFTTCKAKGLTGSQGVIIPHGNQQNLMLKREVTEAVAAGKFHVWAISTVDEGVPLLVDMVAGAPQEDGTYPEGSFYHAVTAGLEAFARADSPENDSQLEEGGPQTALPDKKERALSKLNQAVGEAIKFLPTADEDLSDGHLSTREVLSHLVFWHREYLAVANALIDGQKPPLKKGTFAELNASATQAFSELSLPDLAEQYQELQSELDQALRKIQDWQVVFPLKKGGKSFNLEERIRRIESHIRTHVNRLKRAAHLGNRIRNIES